MTSPAAAQGDSPPPPIGYGPPPAPAQAQAQAATQAPPPPPAYAPTAPSAQDRWWEDPPQEEGDRAARITLTAVGGGLVGLGGLTLFAASVSYLVAAGEAAGLDDECPNKICYEDSPGGDSLERARDAERASAILAGISFPVMAAGLAMTLFGAGLKGSASVKVAPAVGTDGSGLMVEATF